MMSNPWQIRVAVPFLCSPRNRRNLSQSALFNPKPHTWESNVKLITLAAIATLAATPVIAQPIQDEQSRADYHQAKADAARAQMQKEDAKAQADSAQADAAGQQAQANAAQADASNLQARANAAQTQADVAQNQASTSQAQADSAKAQEEQARADRNAALDRAADARNTIENQ
jgi:hypothetical protein